MGKRQKFDYFDAFCTQASIAAEESQALVDLLEDYRPDAEGWMREHIDAMHEIEQRGDAVAHEIMERLAVEFMPPIDREDVTDLCLLFDDVIDQIEEVIQHLYMYDIHELHPYALPVARTIDDSVDALVEAARAFREFKKPQSRDRLLVVVHDKESEGDELYIKAKRDVFANHRDDPASYLIAWNGMFSHMEACCDACEKVASIMQKIALKNT